MAAAFEAQLAPIMAAQFDQQRDQLLGHLDTTRIGTKGYTRKDWLSDLLDWAQAAESFSQAIQPTVHAVLLQAGQDATQSLGLMPNVFDPFTPAIANYFKIRSTKVAKDVTDETEKQLRAALSQGVADGKGSFELRAIVEDVMGSASTVRADRIASYEVTHAQSYADIQAWTQSGVVAEKEWYTAHDERVCPGCRSMDGKTEKLTDNFMDQGSAITVEREGKTPYKLKLDYEDILGCPLHNMCRCVLLPVRN